MPRSHRTPWYGSADRLDRQKHPLVARLAKPQRAWNDTKIACRVHDIFGKPRTRRWQTYRPADFLSCPKSYRREQSPLAHTADRKLLGCPIDPDLRAMC